MISPTPVARAQSILRPAIGAIVVMLLGLPSAADAQGLIQGVQQGAREGNKAAGPVGGVLGGAIGGVVGVVTGVLGAGKDASPPPANGKQGGSTKTAKGSKDGKGAKQPPACPGRCPQLTAEQIVASDANIERIKPN